MNKKAACLLKAFDGLPKGSVLVEIGSARVAHEVPTDGFSTHYLGQAAAERGWTVHSVDIDPQAVLAARSVIGDCPVTVHEADGAAWLAGFDGPINGLFLDGAADPPQALDQYRNAKLAKSAVVVVDDVQPIDDVLRGKGDLLLDALEAGGFVVGIYDTEPDYRMAVAR